MRFGFSDFFFLILVVALADSLIGQVVTGYFVQSWGISEYLINYQGGFVRRGLIGELIYQLHLSGIFPFNPYYTFISISLITYFSVSILLYHIFKKQNIGVFLIPTTILIGFAIIEDAWLRKDSIILLMSYISIKFLSKNNIYSSIAYTIVTCISILIHEVAFFIILPISIYMFYIESNKNTSYYIVNFIVIMFVFTTLYFTFSHSGIYVNTDKIWFSWDNLNLPVTYNTTAIDATAINALKWSPEFSLEYTIDYNLSYNHDIYPLFVWFILIFIILMLLANIKFSPKILLQKSMPDINYKFSELICSISCIQLISIFPLFFLGIDYGRWIYLWTISSLFYTHILRDKVSTSSFPTIINKSNIIVNKLSDNIFNDNKNIYVILSIIVGFPG